MEETLEMICSAMALAFHDQFIGQIVDIRIPDSAEKLAEWSGNDPELIAPIFFAFMEQRYFARPTQKDGVDGIEFLTLDELNEINFAKMADLRNE